MKKHFLTGFALLLPLLITLWIVSFVFDVLTKPFMGLMTHLLETFQVSHQNVRLLQSKEIILYASRVLSLIFLFGLILAVGWLTQWYLIHRFISFGDQILHRIPMVNKIYKATQEVMSTLFGGDTVGEKTPVLIPFPHERSFTIGLSTGSYTAENSPTGAASIAVLILGTPNPSVGFVLLYPADEVKPLDMTMEEAVKCIVSCGSMQTELRLRRGLGNAK